MNGLRKAWGPSAVTRWSVIGAALAVAALALAGGPDLSGFPVTDRVLTAIGAVGVAALVLVLARLTWLRPGQGRHRPVLAIVTFATAGAIAGATRSGLIAAVGARDPLDVAWRVASTSAAAVVWLALTAMVVGHVRDHRAAMTALRRQQAELEALDRHEREELDALVMRLRDELLVPVRAALGRIRTALAAVDSGGPGAAGAARIEHAVAMSIRPLSHRMLTSDPAPAVPEVAVAASRRERTARLVAVASRRVVRRPWVVTLVPVVLVPLMLGPSWGALFMAVNAAVTWPAYSLLLIGLRRALEPRLGGMRAPVAALAVVTGYMAATAVVVGITTALGALSPQAVPYMWIGIVTLTAILVAASVLQAASGLADSDEHAMREALAVIALSLARIQQRLRHEHQVLGSLLHGPVQGALLAVAGSLEQVDERTTDAERHELLDDAARQLAAVERRLEAPADDGQSLDDALDGVLMLWTRVLDVRLEVDDDACRALNATPAARGAVADVLAEALTNAFRHGGARTAWVDISLDACGACVCVVDDGRLAPEANTGAGGGSGVGAGTGMGSRLYDECAQRWSLTRRADGRTELRLVVPVAGFVGARRGPGAIIA